MKLKESPDGAKTATLPPPGRWIQFSPIVLSDGMWKPPVRQLWATIQGSFPPLTKSSVSGGPGPRSSRKATLDQTT